LKLFGNRGIQIYENLEIDCIDLITGLLCLFWFIRTTIYTNHLVLYSLERMRLNCKIIFRESL